MKIDRTKLLGVIAGIIVVIVDLIFFMGQKIFMFIIGIAIVAAVTPFIIGTIRENQREQEIGEKFLEFSRNLAESVMTGTPISKSIVNISKKNYGALTPHVQKLSNQIQLGIPLSKALQIFANDINNVVVTRAIALISEAEKAGGEIDYILDSVAKSIAETEKLKKERKAAIFNLVIQGYIIFFLSLIHI